MQDNIQPFSFGQIFKDSFNVLKKNFVKTLFAIFISYIVIYIIFIIIQIPMISNINNMFTYGSQSVYGISGMPEYYGAWVFPSILLFVYAIQGLILQPFGHGFLINSASHFLHGKRLSFGQVNALTLKKFGLLILSSLAKFVIYLPIFAVTIGGVLWFSYNAANTWQDPVEIIPNVFLFLILYFIFIIVIAFLEFIFIFNLNVTINENKYGFKAVLRSAKLIFKGGFGRTLGHTMLLSLIMGGIFFTLYFVMVIIAILTMIVGAPFVGFFIIAALMLIILSLFMSYSIIFINFLYYNTRIRLEGYSFAKDDIEEL